VMSLLSGRRFLTSRFLLAPCNSFIPTGSGSIILILLLLIILRYRNCAWIDSIYHVTHYSISQRKANASWMASDNPSLSF
jgi:hypothetical protein